MPNLPHCYAQPLLKVILGHCPPWEHYDEVVAIEFFYLNRMSDENALPFHHTVTLITSEENII